jgi:putative FmdB family regulatory protein
MPIYEYYCPICQKEIEILQKMGEADKRKCPECGKSKLKKQASTTSFQLKGQGWYVTDFRDKGKKTQTSTETEMTSGSDGAESKTSTKDKKDKKDKKNKSTKEAS